MAAPTALTRKLGGVPVWGWVTGGGALVLTYLMWRRSQASQAAASTGSTATPIIVPSAPPSAYGVGNGMGSGYGGFWGPIIDMMGPASTQPTGAAATTSGGSPIPSAPSNPPATTGVSFPTFASVAASLPQSAYNEAPPGYGLAHFNNSAYWEPKGSNPSTWTTANPAVA